MIVSLLELVAALRCGSSSGSNSSSGHSDGSSCRKNYISSSSSSSSRSRSRSRSRGGGGGGGARMFTCTRVLILPTEFVLVVGKVLLHILFNKCSGGMTTLSSCNTCCSRSVYATSLYRQPIKKDGKLLQQKPESCEAKEPATQEM